jgi:tRNA(Ile)-lysidine synthase
MLLTAFINHIRDNRLFQSPGQLLLAVSGGIDSVVLCELCHRAGYLFHLAHVNFQLRGKESDEDELLVRRLAEQYNVPLYVKKIDTNAYAETNNLSIQVAARELRYAWFNELLNEELRYVVTAHHADDNIETVLMNFFRGTGISGLRGMLPVTGNIVRPLLPFHKEELLTFAKENQLAWREDSSNASEKYSRNNFRHTIIPAISKIYPAVEQHLVNNIRRFAEIEVLYQQAIAIHKKKLIEQKGAEVHIPVLKLLKTEPLETIVHEIIKDYQFTAHQSEEVIRLLKGRQGSFVQSPTHRIIRNRDWLIISPNRAAESQHVVINKEEDKIEFAAGVLEMKIVPVGKVSLSAHPGSAFLDVRKVAFPLLLRKWRQGDYFYPLGLAKKKKVSRFLIDQKVSPTDKENVWVLESDKRVCWIVGMRIDDRFKITDGTKEVLVFRLK